MANETAVQAGEKSGDVTVRASADVIARHVTGCTVVIERAERNHGFGLRYDLDFYNLTTPAGRSPLAQSESTEALQRWAKKNGAKRAEVLR